MPLYEYVCDSCGHRFEVIQRFSDAPIEVCPKCGARVQKVLSSPAIHFKGSGWYITDYAKKSTTEEGKTREGAGDKGEAGKKADGDTSDASSSSSTTPSSTTPSKDS